jgi:secernin
VGKNSDRPARECQTLRRLPERSAGTTQQLAYVEIDDTVDTIAHVGSSPYWCWGHEMGLNASGVVIGNEALFTRDLADDAQRERRGETVQPGILGMELVRIGLERGTTAAKAVELMGDLIEQYGQWGAGVRGSDRAEAAYDNSYLIADRRQVWVLETSGRRWAARRVVEPSWSISNEATIRDNWDICAGDLESYAQTQGWAVGSGKLDFAATFLDPRVPLQASHIRLQRSRQLLDDALKAHGNVSFYDARRVLSDHYEDTFLGGPAFNPARPDYLTLCMHDHPAGFTWGNTAASMVAILPEEGEPFMWWAAAPPCVSVYLPISVSSPDLPKVLGKAGTQHGSGPSSEGVAADGYTDDSYWWAFQRLLEVVAGDDLGSTYHERQPIVHTRFDGLQQRWCEEIEGVIAGATSPDWQGLTAKCTAEALATARELTADLSA